MSWAVILPVVSTLVAQMPGGEAAGPAVTPLEAPDPGAAAPGPFLPSVSNATSPTPPQTRWYGGLASVLDAVDVGLLVGVFRYSDDYQREHGVQPPGVNAIAAPLVLGYLAIGPILHGIHHHPQKVAASILLRAGALLTAALVDDAVFNHCGGQEAQETDPGGCDLGIGVVIGLPLAALVIDDALLAREEVPTTPATQATWTPDLRVGAGRTLLGLRGTF